jgi:hypothetical protein
MEYGRLPHPSLALPRVGFHEPQPPGLIRWVSRRGLNGGGGESILTAFL